MKWHPKHARPRHWFVKDGRPSLPRVVAAALGVAAAVGVTAAIARGASAPAANGLGPVVVPVASPVGGSDPSDTPVADAQPVSIDIPAIGVHSALQRLGLDGSGALEPPANLTEAGWYTGSAVPGVAGPAVIAGHVDSFNGPAVFFNLKSLHPGDRIAVGLSSGRSVAFQVMSVQRYPKDQFPTLAVYGARPDSELRLITCGGGFADGHYLDNVVVYAALTK
jgi:hypothetical protein